MSFAVSIGLLSGCIEDTEFTKNLNYVTFEATSLDLGVDVDGSTTHTIKVMSSNTSSSDRIFNILVVNSSTADAAAYTAVQTVTIPANSNVGSFELILHDVNIDDGKTLVLSIGKEDGLYTGKNLTINISQICSLNDVVLTINFDDWASECSWELLNAASETIASGDGYNDGLDKLSSRFCLENGTYTFKIYDAYGDGLGDGNAQLSIGSTILFSVSGDFGTEASGTFTVTM